MTTEPFKPEVDAIGAVLKHLEPLPAPARRRVVDYVLEVLDITPSAPGDPGAGDPPRRDTPPPPPPLPGDEGDAAGRQQDIRSLREEKNPTTTIEMAALIGYYLAELAPEGERKEAIGTADLEPLFKQARYPLPTKIRAVLGSAAAAGYFDPVERGLYKLNPVGHNLVVHNLPSGDLNAQPRKRAAKKTTKGAAAKKTAKKAPAKKAPAKKAPAKKAPAKKAAKKAAS